MTGTDAVAVTGATGFIGRALVSALVRRGRAVTAMARREATFEPDVRVARIPDAGPDTDWRRALEGCRWVVHCAGRVHVMAESAADPDAAYRLVNVDGTINLARQAAAAGARRFVFISSIKVNGEATQPGQPFTETDMANPSDAYGRSKRAAEEALLGLGMPMEVVVIRPPLVYGPGVRANFLRMTQWLARGVPLPLGAVRDNRRTLVGLDNLVDLVATCLEHPAAATEVFLAGDAESLSTAELLRRTAAALGRRARLVPVPVAVLRTGAALLGRRDFFQRLCGSLEVSIAKAERVLGWRPPVSVADGLQRAVGPGDAARAEA